MWWARKHSRGHYMTGNDDPAVRQAALDSGCIAFWLSPFEITVLQYCEAGATIDIAPAVSAGPLPHLISPTKIFDTSVAS
jgi:hypothetical protein